MKILEKIFMKFLEKVLRNSELTPKKWRHIADTKTGQFYHLDENNMVWTCDCMSDANERVSLCITMTPDLKLEGELNELKRAVAEKRKELGFLMSETLEEGYKRLIG